MVLHNPNNWHWVNKDVSPWARQYLEETLIGLKVEDNGVNVQVDKILSMDGDVDVSQRKGKVITLFDVKLQLEYSGKTANDEAASGTITVPEVAHDTEQDEYVFEIDVRSDSSKKQPIRDLVRSKLTPLLRQKLSTLGPELISTHSKDIQHGPDSQPSFPAAKVYSSSSVNKSGASSAGSSTPTVTTASSNVNVTTLNDSEEFRTTAEELYQTFTDPQRLAAFTRAPPKVFEGAKVGGKFELFDGNVVGEFTELSPPKTLVQKWRLNSWPAGHFSTLKIEFSQNDVDRVTVMRVAWTDVPVGQEEVTKRNWKEYYVRSIKITFGFGTVL